MVPVAGISWLLLMAMLTEGLEYKAAVVEYSPDQTTVDIEDRIQNNLKGYEEALKVIENEGVQIVVFPEDGLCGFSGLSLNALKVYFEPIPDPEQGSNPCVQNEFKELPILQSLSCLARKYNIVLVANMGDKRECNRTSDANCPEWGSYYYNTDVVFENDGTLIAKYHKIHLFSGEKVIFSSGNQTNGVSFRTNFGVTFGIFTCYDILFDNPTGCLLDSSINNFVFPTAWGNKYPFYMSTIVQQGWSYRNKVNLLASNLHIVFELNQFYGTGSGLYCGGNAKSYFLSGDTMASGQSEVLVAVLSNDRSGCDSSDQNSTVINPTAIKAKIVEGASYEMLDVNDNSASASVTYNGHTITCRLKYKVTTSKENEVYGLSAYFGNGEGDFDYAVCYVTKCDNRSACGHIVTESDTTFQMLELSGTFPPSSEVYPSVFSSQYKLLNPASIVFSNNTIAITSPSNIISIGLWSMVGQAASVCHST